jgi:hypothetical protein
MWITIRACHIREPVMRIPILVLLVASGIAAAETPTIQVAPTVPPVFRLLAEPAVQKDISLTDEQRAAADAVRRQLAIPSRAIYLGNFGTVPAESIRAGRIGMTDKFLAKTLTKEQRTRLDQILFQLREKEFGPHMAFAMAARDLGLRADQLEDVRSLKGLRVEEIAKTVTSGQRFEKIKIAVQATNGDTFAKMTEMLTRAQRERLKDLKGKEFAGKVDLTTQNFVLGKPKYAGPIFGIYDLELYYIVQPTIRRDLKLTDSQTDALLAAREESLEGIVNGRVLFDWEDKVHILTEKALARLNQEQRSRFDQIMMQRRAQASREAVCGYPAAIATLKLSPIQVSDLRSGKSLEEVLNKEQLSRYGKLFGEDYDLPMHVKDGYVTLTPRAPVRPQPKSGQPIVAARSFLALTERLGLSAEQVKKLRDLAEDEPKIRELIYKELSFDDTPPVSGSGRALTALNAVSEQYREAVDQQCWDVLDAPQKSLARQLFGRRK